MTLGLLDLYGRVKEKLRPTPANAHYIFSLHDIARVVHGILLMSPRSRSRKMMRKKKDGDSSNYIFSSFLYLLASLIVLDTTLSDKVC
jgi:hypothetical protein